MVRIKYVQPELCSQSYKSILGQRPIWDWRNDKLLWVDIYENKIIQSDENILNEKHFLVPEGITNILLQDNDQYMMSSYDALFSINLKSTKKNLLSKINFTNADNRINDANVDLNGQVWISTMDVKQQFETGKIICHNQSLKPIYSDNSYIISNGPIFDFERNYGYVTDSIKRIIYRFSLNNLEEEGIQKKVFLSMNDIDGNPDGMTVDKNGNLWVAMWGSGKVCCFDKEGHLSLILQLPVSKVTSCTFGGKDLSTLFITTASVGLNDIEIERQPHAGKLFCFHTQEEGYAANCYRSDISSDLYH